MRKLLTVMLLALVFPGMATAQSIRLRKASSLDSASSLSLTDWIVAIQGTSSDDTRKATILQLFSLIHSDLPQYTEATIPAADSASAPPVVEVTNASSYTDCDPTSGTGSVVAICWRDANANLWRSLAGSGGGSESTTVSDTATIDLELDTYEITGTVQSNSIDASHIDETDSYTWSGTSSFTGTLRTPNGTTLPGTCVVGDTFLDTDADTDGSRYDCVATNTWKEVDDDSGGAPTTDSVGLDEIDDGANSPLDGQVLRADGSGAGAVVKYGDLVPANADCDETDDTLCVGDGSQMRGEVLPEGPAYWDADSNGLSKYQECDSQTVQSLADADDNLILWGGSIYTVDITRVWAHCRGTCDGTISFEDGDGNAITHGAITLAESGAATAVIPSSTNTLSPYEALAIDVDSITTETDDYTVGWCWEVSDAN